MARISDPIYARLLDQQFTPNDRARFLDSATRLQAQTPLGLHQVSPVLISFPVSGGALKPLASTLSLRRLLAEEGIKRQKPPIPLETLVEEGLNRGKIASFRYWAKGSTRLCKVLLWFVDDTLQARSDLFGTYSKSVGIWS
jgi:hypothetical protein